LLESGTPPCSQFDRISIGRLYSMLSLTSPAFLQFLFFLPYISIATTGVALVVANTIFIAKLVGCLHLILIGAHLVGILGNHPVKVYTILIDLGYLVWTASAVPLLDVTFSDLGVHLVLQLFWLPQIVYLIIVVAIPSASVVVSGKLLLGNSTAATSEDIMSEYKVTHVLELCDDKKKNDPSKVPVDTLLQLQCSDELGAKDSVIKISKEAIEFINETTKQKDAVVLVHCSAGVSRSPAMVVQWLVSTGKVESVQAGYELVRTARPIVDIRKEHMDALKKVYDSKED
jgi:protein-tyrosine phosphatase